jgi:hypothetical protein
MTNSEMDANYSKPEPPPVVLEPDASTTGAAPTPERTRGADGRWTTPKAAEEQKTAKEQEWFDKMRAGMKENLLPGVEQAQAAKAKADAPEQANGSEAESVDKEALAAALLNAKRLKIPAKALDAMSPTELVQAGQDWKAQIAESGKLSQKFGELEKQIEAIRSGKVAASGTPDQPAKDLAAYVQPLVADYDESTKNLIGGLAKEVDLRIQVIQRAADERVAKLEESLGKLQTASGLTVAEGIRAELKGAYPQLGKADAWNSVLARADVLARLPEYQGNPRQAIEHAVRIEIGSPQASANVPESNRGKRNGVASTTSQAPRGRSDSQEDRDRAVYNRIFNLT